LSGTPNQAQQSCVDEKSKNGVAHKKDKREIKRATALAGAARPG
jgi:hypothetical protein